MGFIKKEISDINELQNKINLRIDQIKQNALNLENSNTSNQQNDDTNWIITLIEDVQLEYEEQVGGPKQYLKIIFKILNSREIYYKDIILNLQQSYCKKNNWKFLDALKSQSKFDLQRNRSNELHNESVVKPNLFSSLEILLEKYDRSDEMNHTIADEPLKTQMNYYEPGYESNNNPQKLYQPNVKLSHANPFIEESKIMENQSNDHQKNTENDELLNMSQAGIISSDQYILSKKPNSNQKQRRECEKELIRFSSQVELSRFSKQLTRNVYKLSNQYKQKVICYNDHDNKIIVGQNDNTILIFDSEMQFERSLQLESELISILKLNGLFFFGMMQKKVIVFRKDLNKVVKEIDTIECVYKFVYYQHQDPNLDYSKEYLILLEKEGFIQFFSFQEKKIVFTQQHSSKISIQDGLQVAKKNQLCLALAQLVDNTYKNGRVSFIDVIIKQATHIKKQLQYKTSQEVSLVEIQIQELVKENYLDGSAIFNVLQIFNNQFIVCVQENKFLLINRSLPDQIKKIRNPSKSINYNSLVKIDGFSDELPYLIYRDSRCIGVINCKTLTASTIISGINYSRCGNIFSLDQYRNSDGKLNLLTFIFDRDSNKREIKSFQIDINGFQ
ncbi:UNKNOWN [Stylonychia lemnae]|uniref:Uncharacterized protein n=1 Tax=Stylonychia lemnae TaxID=5949 RepID=A0A078AI01_STYLE|nr:UNKNOWN [Stylonychia lemnae]|eukprot:CDW81142.1 UNKNOWN [Stylonychia lemnae]